ncbi:MAG: hypothetical protein WAW37_13240 [Syntrophobacteraceae bacterium]
MKKSFLVILALLFVAVWVSVAAAAPNVASVSQKGSVLVFPRFDISGDKDTVVILTNDYKLPVWVRGIYVSPTQETNDFLLELSPFKTISWSIRYGKSDFIATVPRSFYEKGYLIIFASDSTGTTQLNWNHLYALAKLVDYSAQSSWQAWEYQPWTFAARTASLGQPVGDPGLIVLDGASFDACPQYLNYNIMMSGEAYDFFQDTQLTLLPCKQDVTQYPKATRTKAVFQIANENETWLSGAEKCVSCWFEYLLSGISPNFLKGIAGTSAGHFKVYGVASPKCNITGNAAVATPFVGVAVEKLNFLAYGPVELAGTEGTSSGVAAGFIKYDSNPSDIPEGPGK